jgi:hypothetical protein
MPLARGQSVPAALAQALVIDRGGNESPLGDRWARRPVVVVILRHFGCVACAEHVALLAPRLHELARLGFGVVYVGNGAEHFMSGFVERNQIDETVVELVTDPTLGVHGALGLARSRTSAYGPGALVGLARGLLRGFRQGRIEGDGRQQGGVLVIDAAGRVAYLHRDRHTGDHAPTHDVIDAAMQVAAADARIP